MGLTLFLIVFFNLYLLINFGRLIKRRMQPDYLRTAFWKTTVWLVAVQILIILTSIVLDYVDISLSALIYIMVSGQFLTALILLCSTLRHLKTTSPPVISSNYAEQDLPTLSVCIPARNESEDLEACLRSLIASDFPKLEILVLDDCSQDKHTPEIIRSFAHDGVRFISGKEPSEHWLAKNYAYHQLASEANGELLLFCGVDSRFEPFSLSAIVKALMKKQKSMISFIPKNILSDHTGIKPMLTQPSRYAWELALPRRFLKRPPVLSTCWIITRQAFETAGQFGAVSRKCVPESYFAGVAAEHNDGYSFLQAGPGIGVTSTKSYNEQLATAVRTRYPQLRRRPELVALVGLAEFFSLVAPFILFWSSLLAHRWLFASLSGLCCLLLIGMYVSLSRLTYREFQFNSLWMLPFAALYDIGLLNYSMWKYEFNEVIWKGRNICLPIMRAIPSLPKIDQN